MFCIKISSSIFTVLLEFKKCLDNALSHTARFLCGPMWSQGLDSVILMGLYQLQILSNSIIRWSSLLLFIFNKVFFTCVLFSFRYWVSWLQVFGCVWRSTILIFLYILVKVCLKYPQNPPASKYTINYCVSPPIYFFHFSQSFSLFIQIFIIIWQSFGGIIPTCISRFFEKSLLL